MVLSFISTFLGVMNDCQIPPTAPWVLCALDSIFGYKCNGKLGHSSN